MKLSLFHDLLSKNFEGTLTKYIYKFISNSFYFSFLYLLYQIEDNCTSCICIIVQYAAEILHARHSVKTRFKVSARMFEVIFSHVVVARCKVCRSVDENQVEGTTLEGTPRRSDPRRATLRVVDCARIYVQEVCTWEPHALHVASCLRRPVALEQLPLPLLCMVSYRAVYEADGATVRSVRLLKPRRVDL